MRANVETRYLKKMISELQNNLSFKRWCSICICINIPNVHIYALPFVYANNIYSGQKNESTLAGVEPAIS